MRCDFPLGKSRLFLFPFIKLALYASLAAEFTEKTLRKKTKDLYSLWQIPNLHKLI